MHNDRIGEDRPAYCKGAFGAVGSRFLSIAKEALLLRLSEKSRLSILRPEVGNAVDPFFGFVALPNPVICRFEA